MSLSARSVPGDQRARDAVPRSWGRTGRQRWRWLPLLAGLLGVPTMAEAELLVDFSQAAGSIRPLHGVNLGPLCYRGMVDLTAYHSALNLPLTRVHDVVLETPWRVKTPPCVAGQVAICAGLNSDRSRAALLLSGFYPADGPSELVLQGLPWSGPTRFELHLVDAHRDFDLTRRGVVESAGRLSLPELNEPAVVLLRLSPMPVDPKPLNPDSTR